MRKRGGFLIIVSLVYLISCNSDHNIMTTAIFEGYAIDVKTGLPLPDTDIYIDHYTCVDVRGSSCGPETTLIKTNQDGFYSLVLENTNGDYYTVRGEKMGFLLQNRERFIVPTSLPNFTPSPSPLPFLLKVFTTNIDTVYMSRAAHFKLNVQNEIASIDTLSIRIYAPEVFLDWGVIGNTPILNGSLSGVDIDTTIVKSVHYDAIPRLSFDWSVSYNGIISEGSETVELIEQDTVEYNFIY